MSDLHRDHRHACRLIFGHLVWGIHEVGGLPLGDITILTCVFALRAKGRFVKRPYDGYRTGYIYLRQHARVIMIGTTVISWRNQ